MTRASTANTAMLTATVTHSVVEKPVCQVPDICTTAHTRGPATATASTVQYVPSRSLPGRRLSTANGTMAASADRLKSRLWIMAMCPFRLARSADVDRWARPADGALGKPPPGD